MFNTLKAVFARRMARFRELTLMRQRLVIVCLVVAVAMLVLAFSSGGDAGVAVIAVTRGSIAQTVSVTGGMKPTDDVELAFQNSGRISVVNVSIGDRVKAGQLLAGLSSGELSAQLRDAQANVAAQQARLDEVVNGTRPEDLSIKQTELLRAQQDLAYAYDNGYDVLSDALTGADNAIRIQLEGMFDDVGTIDSPSFKLEFSCFCDQLDLLVNEQRGDTEDGLRAWQEDMSEITSSTPDAVIMTNLQSARARLQTGKIMLENLNTVLNHPTVGLPADTAATYKTSVSAARSSVVAAQVSVASQEQAILTYQLAVDRVTVELDKLRNGSTTQTLAVQRALLQSAQAQADRISALLAKNYITSPIVGLVTVQDAKVGQNATANVPVISVISDQQLEIEANVPEVDIGKVSVGDGIALTVDALPGETLRARVSFIDPAETVIDGVVNFRILAQLEQSDERLKSGLTVNMDIESERKNDALLLPQFAIIENNEGTFVRRPDGTETPVVVGIRSQDGMVEIVSGLSEGDVVVNIGLKSSQ